MKVDLARGLIGKLQKMAKEEEVRKSKEEENLKSSLTRGITQNRNSFEDYS